MIVNDGWWNTNIKEKYWRVLKWRCRQLCPGRGGDPGQHCVSLVGDVSWGPKLTHWQGWHWDTGTHSQHRGERLRLWRLWRVLKPRYWIMTCWWVWVQLIEMLSHMSWWRLVSRDSFIMVIVQCKLFIISALNLYIVIFRVFCYPLVHNCFPSYCKSFKEW